MNEENKEKQILIYLSIPEQLTYRDMRKALRNAVYKISQILEETPLPEGYEKWAPAIINITEDVYHINPYDIVNEPEKWNLFKLSIATLNIAKADIVWFPNGFDRDDYSSMEYDICRHWRVKYLTEDDFDSLHPGFVGAGSDIPKAETELLKEEVKQEQDTAGELKLEEHVQNSYDGIRNGMHW